MLDIVTLFLKASTVPVVKISDHQLEIPPI